MFKYILKRLVQSVPVFFLIITATFFMVRFVPGGPFDSERKVSQQSLEILNQQYGLDEPLIVQYGIFLKNLANFDLGVSLKYNAWSVSEILFEKAKVSIELGLYALFTALFFGILLGILSALFKKRKISFFISGLSLLGICLPSFVLGPLLILVFAVNFKIFNAIGWSNSPKDIILPTITLAMFYIAWIARLMRSSILEEEGRQYVRTAYAKGMGATKVYSTHILKNAIQPIISYTGPAAAALLTGSFVVETLFQIPGLGRFFISSALDNDYSMIMGCVIIYAFLIIFFNLLSDILLAIVNPKIAKQIKK